MEAAAQPPLEMQALGTVVAQREVLLKERAGEFTDVECNGELQRLVAKVDRDAAVGRVGRVKAQLRAADAARPPRRRASVR